MKYKIYLSKQRAHKPISLRFPKRQVTHETLGQAISKAKDEVLDADKQSDAYDEN